MIKLKKYIKKILIFKKIKENHFTKTMILFIKC